MGWIQWEVLLFHGLDSMGGSSVSWIGFNGRFFCFMDWIQWEVLLFHGLDSMEGFS